MVEHTRTLGFTVAFAIGLGTMIAAGIFSLSGTAVAALSVEPTVHSIAAETVADGLVRAAAEQGGLLFIGATRNRRARRWVFGSTPDRVIGLARETGVPVLVFASIQGVSGRLEDYLYPVYRYARKLLRERRGPAREPPSAQPGTDGTG